MSDGMTARRRRDLIARRVRETGSVEVADLMAEFGLTDTSIRRDLTILEKRGVLRRVRGGGVQTTKALELVGHYVERTRERWDEKRAIASAAVGYVNPEDVIVLDSGTTVLAMARRLAQERRRLGTLRIVTNSIALLDEVGVWAKPNLMVLGGIYLPEHRATAGPEALKQLNRISADRAFLGCDGLTLDEGITTAHPLIAETGRKMAERAGEVIVLADHTKLGRAGFVSIMPNEMIDVLITDADAPEGVVARLRDQGVDVVLVEKGA
jgi:DeoR/GlpR family transcriptional regulator of sugar metabolism